jgi:hypothetical protein
MTHTARLLLVALLLVAGPGRAFGQSPVSEGPIELYELVLKDGSRIYGSIERESDVEVVLRTQAGAIVTASRGDIVSLRLVKGRIERGEFMRPDLHRTRLFFAPTARSLDQGEVSFGVFEFVAPFVQAGVTDRISVGGGTPLVFGFDESYRPFWITPKVQVLRTRDAQAAVGLLHLFNAEGDSGGIAYGVTTLGNNDHAFTGGAGLAYADGDRGWLVMGGGETRVRSNLKLMTENYAWEGGGILSGGVRFLGERLSADLALAMPIGADDLIVFPVVNFVYVFGK